MFHCSLMVNRPRPLHPTYTAVHRYPPTVFKHSRGYTLHNYFGSVWWSVYNSIFFFFCRSKSLGCRCTDVVRFVFNSPQRFRHFAAAVKKNITYCNRRKTWSSYLILKTTGIFFRPPDCRSTCIPIHQVGGGYYLTVYYYTDQQNLQHSRIRITPLKKLKIYF